MLQAFELDTCANGSLGLRLSRAPWDPYPWISSVQKNSCSDMAGLHVGDTVLELNGYDILGLRICEIAEILKIPDNHTTTTTTKDATVNDSSKRRNVRMLVWRNKVIGEGLGLDKDQSDAHNINRQSLEKFAVCLQHIAQLLECPVCLDIIKPPGWQCCNGHTLCNNCRNRSVKCPVCRVPLGPRGRCLLSDKLYHLLAESFPCDSVRNSVNTKCLQSRREGMLSKEFIKPPANDQHEEYRKQRHRMPFELIKKTI